MRKFSYNKLVRDKIVASMEHDGEKPQYRVLSDTEYLQELQNKLLEEAQEMDLSKTNELVKEIADLQEVLDCMVVALGKSKTDVSSAQAKKNAKAGSFAKKLFVDTVETPDDAPWLQYLLDNPDRYPEITQSES